MGAVPNRTVANDPGGRRNVIVGVCAAGQAAGKPVFTVDYAHPGQTPGSCGFSNRIANGF